MKQDKIDIENSLNNVQILEFKVGEVVIISDNYFVFDGCRLKQFNSTKEYLHENYSKINKSLKNLSKALYYKRSYDNDYYYALDEFNEVINEKSFIN